MRPLSADTAADVIDKTGIKGGLVVHLGCGDGKLTAALRRNERYLVHGLDADVDKVRQARRHIQSLGLYGKVSIGKWTANRLPYADNLVNLIVVSDDTAVQRDELLRILAPRGIALLASPKTGEGKGGRNLLPERPATNLRSVPGSAQKVPDPFSVLVKPRPADIDDWTHWRHDATGNAVARDTRVGPPRSVQWIAEPLWSRGHEVITSVGAVVTARGRIFYVVDEAQTSVYELPSKWMLACRDAMNGVLLWKRPIPHWSPPVVLGGFARGFRPARLATDGERV